MLENTHMPTVWALGIIAHSLFLSYCNRKAESYCGSSWFNAVSILANPLSILLGFHYLGMGGYYLGIIAFAFVFAYLVAANRRFQIYPLHGREDSKHYQPPDWASRAGIVGLAISFILSIETGVVCLFMLFLIHSFWQTLKMIDDEDEEVVQMFVSDLQEEEKEI